jgi:hypothetical protein
MVCDRGLVPMITVFGMLFFQEYLGTARLLLSISPTILYDKS